MEVIEQIFDDAHVKGKMHLLVSGHFESKDSLYQTLEDVYHNFTSIRKACVSLQKKTPEEHKSGALYTRFLVRFCQCSLKRILEEDGITVHQSLARLLSDIELHLLVLVKNFTESSGESNAPPLDAKDYIVKRIDEAYSESSPIYCYQLIVNYDLMMEFLDQFIEDFDEDTGQTYSTVCLNFIVLRDYLEFLIKERLHSDNLQKLLIDVENDAYEMVRYLFYEDMGENFQSGALILQSDCFIYRDKGKMHLLISGHFESKDLLYQTLEDVYNNFTSIQKACIDLLEEDTYSKKYVGLMITFCRCSLKRIIEEDGITIRKTLAHLLAEIELQLIKYLTDKLSSSDVSDVFPPAHEREDMEIRIRKAYSEAEDSPIYCHRLITNYELMMEFLKDLYSFDTDGDTNIIVLRNYFELLTADRIHDDNLDKWLITVENVAYKMARYIYFRLRLRREYFVYDDTESGFHAGVLKALVFQTDEFRKPPLMSDELLTGYVKCIQDHLEKLLEVEDNRIDLTETLVGPLMNLHEGLSFLMHLLIAYPLKHNEKLSNISFDFQALARSVGSVIISCLDSPNIEERSIGIFGLVEKANCIQGEIIKTICCMVLQETQPKSPKTDQLGSLILLLQNLHCIPGLIVTWKDHENLVLFMFYLIQNNIRGGNYIDHEDFSHVDIALIKHEEVNGVFVSAQVAAFNMACDSLLRRDGRFRWWELYFYSWDKECINIHMRIGILRAIVLSSTSPLTDELLNAYGECVQENLTELLNIEAFGLVLQDQFNTLHEGFSFLWRFLITYKDEQEKLSHIKAGFQDLVRSLASEVCLCFSNWLRVDVAEPSTADPSQLMEKMNLVIVETEELLHLESINKIGRESPKTNQLGSLNLVLQNWKGLMKCESDLIITWKDQFQMIHENLVFFKSFITGSNTDDESKNLCSSITDAGHVAEYLLATFSAGACPARCRDLWILEFMKHVELIKATVMILNEKKGNLKEISTAGNDQSQLSAQELLVPVSTDEVIGFKVEMKLIRERLFSHLKQMDVISIVGMPGLGKSTLARKVYDDAKTKKHFDARAWCCISQKYNKKDLLLDILGSMSDLTDGIRGQSESELSVLVHKQLLGRRYFIVLDDIWDINAFMYLKCFFPDNNKGSRILLTSRDKVIGSQAQRNGKLIEPCVLSDELSWDLLKRKVYNKGICPPELCQIGKEIAKSCRGLPLAVVVVGGVLAKGSHKQEFWKQVRGNLSSYLARDSQSQFMAALELSYEFLPDCLKPMFLYLGAFPEDKEILADKLMRLWIAEGFMQNTHSTNLEIQAARNLMDLIDRSLITVAKRRWDGRVKACHVHDLLRDMCLAKAEEEKFMQQMHVHSKLPDPVMYQRRLSIFLEGNEETTSRHLAAYRDLPKFSITPPIYSLLFFRTDFDTFRVEGLGGIISNLKLLKVFDAAMLKVTQDVLDKDLIMLVHLRYLSICGDDLKSIPSKISRLQSLETLIVRGFGRSYRIIVPETILEMKKLRYLSIDPCFEFSDVPENSFISENLETISELVFDLGKKEHSIKKVAGLKKLICFFDNAENNCDDQLPNLKSLGKLESLRVSSREKLAGHLRGQLSLLPPTLKKLSISNFRLEWSDILIFQTLPNLEVLKLHEGAVEGESWDMGDEDVFANLKFLKLDRVHIRRWNASSFNFPHLEKLVIDKCYNLAQMPSRLEEFDTLLEIEVRGFSDSTVLKLAKKIKRIQKKRGNELLKFYIYIDNSM